MKFTLAASALASAAIVAADSAVLSVTSGDQTLGYLYSKHEGAGFNYFFLTNSAGAQTFDYNASTKQLSFQAGAYPYNFGSFAPYLAVGPAVTPVALTLDGDKITNFNFWSCSNTQDPYGYSNSEKVIAINSASNSTAPFPSCTKVDVRKKSAAASSSSAGSTTTTWSNTTVTSYTTYCPLPTVVTITSCSSNACAPTAITVTTATTITCTACVAPTTTVAPTSKTTTSVAPSSVTVINGAGKNAMGAIGIAGIAAFLL